MAYVDGFVIPVPKRKVQAYRRLAQKSAKFWKKYGAQQYVECVGDDLQTTMGLSFPKLAKLKPGETVVFSWVVYRSKAERDRANAKIMKDPELMSLCDPKQMPFDMKRMSYAGFKVLVEE